MWNLLVKPAALHPLPARERRRLARMEESKRNAALPGEGEAESAYNALRRFKDRRFLDDIWLADHKRSCWSQASLQAL